MPPPVELVRLLIGSESSSLSSGGTRPSRKPVIACVVCSPWPNTPSRETTASRPGKIAETVK